MLNTSLQDEPQAAERSIKAHMLRLIAAREILLAHVLPLAETVARCVCLVINKIYVCLVNPNPEPRNPKPQTQGEEVA